MSALHVLQSSDISTIQRLFQSIHRNSDSSKNANRHSRPLDFSHLTIVSSPFDDLPLEVIQQIFLYCLPNGHNPIIGLEQPPLLLTQISTKWRNIAVHTPLLWASIHISSLQSSLEELLFDEDQLTEDEAEMDASLEYLNVICGWLDMSSTHPLNISHIDLGPIISPGLTVILSEVVLEYASRIENLDITVNEPTLRTLDVIQPHLLSLLRSLRVKFPSINTAQHLRCTGLLQAPKLRSLDLRRISVPITELPVAWDQLTHLSLREQHDALSPVHLALADVGTVLRSARHLISCEVEIYNTSDEDSSRDLITEPIFLPHLRRLAIHEHDGNLESFFSFLDPPHLEHLEFYTDASAIPRPPPTVLSFLKRMGGQLQIFGTNLVRFSSEDFTQTLRSCPYLMTLSIKSFDVVDEETHRSSFMMASILSYQKRLLLNDQFLRFFTTLDTTGAYLVPKLNRMEFLDGFKFSIDAVVGFIRFKKTGTSGVHKMRTLTLRRGEGPEGKLDLDLDQVGGIASEVLQAKLDLLYNS